jgi:hypothetical protein
MIEKEKPRIFVSHTATDKVFARYIAFRLKELGYSVWFDDWEIAVGDSIVEKVFNGLGASDALIVVLSPTSVLSRWVKEELNVGVMRRIQAKDIRILPVLIETCDVPIPLTHLRYADFRKSREEGMGHLLEGIRPGHLLWKSLAQLDEDYCRLFNELITKRELNEVSVLLKIYDLLRSALDLRYEIELRRTGGEIRTGDLFDEIMFLYRKGLDVRSSAWNELVQIRSSIAHGNRNGFSRKLAARWFDPFSRKLAAKWFDPQNLAHLKGIMRLLCCDR